MNRGKAVRWFLCMAFTWAPLPTNGRRFTRISRERIKFWRWTCWGSGSLSDLMSRCLRPTTFRHWLSSFERNPAENERRSLPAVLGAGFATILAAQHPELVQRLILLMPVGRVEFGTRRLPKRYGLFSRVPAPEPDVLSALSFDEDSDPRLVEELRVYGL